MSSQSPLKQSLVSEDAEDSHKVSIAAPLGTYTCLFTSVLDSKEKVRAYERVKDNHSGLPGTGLANTKHKMYCILDDNMMYELEGQKLRGGFVHLIRSVSDAG